MFNSGYSITQLFAGRLFVTPEYRRAYVWQPKQCAALLQDIETLPPTEEHYLDTLVLQSQATQPIIARDGKGYHYFQVIDGQQRLTTLVILLWVLRQALVANGDNELASNIATAFVVVKRRSMTEKPLYKLTLQDDCQEFFTTTILSNQPSAAAEHFVSHTYLRQAYAYFERYFTVKKQQLSAGSYADWLLQLYEKTTQNLKVSLYEVKQTADGHHLAELIHHRGYLAPDLSAGRRNRAT